MFITSKSLVNQVIIVLINVTTGVLITRTADYSLRADISIVGSIIGVSLVVLNQGYFESLIKNYGVKSSKNIFFRFIAMLLLAIGLKNYLEIDWKVTCLVFLYMAMSMFVQFKSTHIFHLFGNDYYLRLNIIFYSVNLFLTGIIIFWNQLSVETWLIASLIANICLLAIYKLKISQKLLKNTTSTVIPNNFLSVVAAISATQDFIVILIAKEFTTDMNVALLVVAYSCVSPFMIIVSAYQNNIIHNPKIIETLMTKMINYRIALVIPILIIYGLILKLFVTLIFGEKYSTLSNSVILILLFGLLNMFFKILNSVYRGTGEYGFSLLLSSTFLISFAFLANFLPTSQLMLLKASVMASSMSIALSLMVRFWWKFKQTQF